jgi:alkaline phosphatase D
MFPSRLIRRAFLAEAATAPLALSMLSAPPCWAQKPDTKGIENLDLGPSGPMVGHTTSTFSSVWMYAPAGVKVAVRYAPEGAAEPPKTAKVESVSTQGLELRGQPWRALLTNLSPDTRYQFEVALDGKTAPEHRGSFQTSAEAGSPAKFRLGLTSCMKHEKPQQAWSLFLKDKPTLHLTIGDTIYAHTTDPRIQWRHHLRYRRISEFAPVIRNMATYALWDDHDYGPNNSDGRAKGKEQSLSGWNRVWINPDAGTPQIPGAFYRFAWGDVEFFVVDGRYYRSPPQAPDDENKRMLGDAQFAWLLDGLKASKAKFKVIVSGSTLHHSENDGWRLYTYARHRLFDAINKNRLSGVVYFSGSLHNSLAWEHHESDRVGYPLVEVISSGIANGKHLSYATIDFDTTLDDPTMAVRIVRGTTGKVHDEASWSLSQLTHKTS